MRIIVFGAQAKRDLQEAWDYIAADSVAAADHFAIQLDNALELLSKMPGVGHQRDDVQSRKYRCWTVRPYVIVYRFTSKTLTVVRLLHGARDFRKQFRKNRGES